MAVLPPDPIYQSDVGAINLNYDNTIAGINFDRTQLGQQYGFDAQGNLDPSNPFSIAANLQRRYQQGQRGTTNSMAAAGQLYSRAHQRNLDEGTYQYQRSYDTARRDALNTYRDLTEREQRATSNRTMGINTADANRLLRYKPEDVVPPAAAPDVDAPRPHQPAAHPARLPPALRRALPRRHVRRRPRPVHLRHVVARQKLTGRGATKADPSQRGTG